MVKKTKRFKYEAKKSAKEYAVRVNDGYTAIVESSALRRYE